MSSAGISSLDFGVWRARVMALLAFISALLVAYWGAWFADRRLVAADHTAEYAAFEQSFPLADAWLLGAAIVAAIQLWRRHPSAFLWLVVTGGVGLYLCALDVLYDLEHGIYVKGNAGAVELGINFVTAVLSIGILTSAWRFRRELLGNSTSTSQRSSTTAPATMREER